MNNNKYQPDLKANKHKQSFRVGRLVSTDLLMHTREKEDGDSPSVLVGFMLDVLCRTTELRCGNEKKQTKREQWEGAK